jgi:hypothetical protein
MDYDALKKKEEELRAKREKLLAECEKYQDDIYQIQKEMAKLDHTKIRLDDSTDFMLRNYIDFYKSDSRSEDYHEMRFYKYYPRMFPGEKVYHEDSILKIVQFCEHKSAIISLSEHAFDISCEVLGEPHKKYHDGDMDSYTWILRK